MQPTTNNNDWPPVFPYHVHNQTDFDYLDFGNPFIREKGFIYLGISRISFSP